MPAETEPVIVREVHINASRETVFAFLTNAERIAAWMGRHAQADARPGGMLRIEYNGFDVMRGEFVEVEPPSRVVYAWGWEGQMSDGPGVPGMSRVEFTLAAEGAGTLLRMVHSGLDQQAASSHEMGWDHFLPRLVERAEGRDPGADAWMDSPADALALELRDLMAEARKVIDAVPAPKWNEVAPADGRTRAVVAHHVVGHLRLADLAGAIARGERSPLAELTIEGLHGANAQHASAFANVARADVLRELDAATPGAVNTVRGLGRDGLHASQPMTFAGGAALTAEDIVRGPLLANIREHLEALR